MPISAVTRRAGPPVGAAAGRHCTHDLFRGWIDYGDHVGRCRTYEATSRVDIAVLKQRWAPFTGKCLIICALDKDVSSTCNISDVTRRSNRHVSRPSAAGIVVRGFHRPSSMIKIDL